MTPKQWWRQANKYDKVMSFVDNGRRVVTDGHWLINAPAEDFDIPSSEGNEKPDTFEMKCERIQRSYRRRPGGPITSSALSEDVLRRTRHSFKIGRREYAQMRIRRLSGSTFSAAYPIAQFNGRTVQALFLALVASHPSFGLEIRAHRTKQRKVSNCLVLSSNKGRAWAIIAECVL